MRKLRLSRNIASLAVPVLAAGLGALLSLGLGVSCANTSGSQATGTGAHTSSSGTHSGGAGSVASGTGGSSSSSAHGGAGGGTPKPCAADADCAGNPNGSFCDTSTGKCVGCLPSNDQCPSGQYCDMPSETCLMGCKANADCANDPQGNTFCGPMHACVACVMDGDCPAGSVCLASGGICIPGCSASHGCAAGQTCCGASCHDLSNDFLNCGMCNNACTNPPNATGQCLMGMCQLKACLPNFANCDGSMANGCEQNVLEDGACTCMPGQTQPCYQGAPGTEGVGPCHGGMQACDPSGTGWGDCLGQVLPIAEICNNNVDDDCNGVIDDVPDLDGDGWTVCNGDCCEVAGPNCTNPALVNPGAFEVPGDGVDNDCDGVVDNPVTTVCGSAGNKFAGVTGTDVIEAMDICQFTTANPPLPMKKWGVISATQIHADGSAVNANEATNQQTAIKTKFGTGGVVPKANGTLAVISSGMARDAADAGFVAKIPGSVFTSSIAFTAGTQAPLGTYITAHGDALLPGHCGSTTCPVGSSANDSIDIRLVIRVPTNAQGFSYNFRFYSAEYQTYQCTQYNDYYLALLQSGSPSIPADHNISFDALNNPVSVNNGFFQDCGGNGKGCGTCPFGISSLTGTGFDTVAGGSTEWLTTDAPVLPGETITLDLMVFDVSDHFYDTLMLLDNFQWDLTPVTLGTHT